MIFTAYADGIFHLADRVLRCALGINGVVEACAKREGDGRSPAGVWPLRRVLYRPDRSSAPDTRLPSGPIGLLDGWCDDPLDPAYNHPVSLPYPASAESLWRDDRLYDLVVALGHNEAPVVPGAGSAIFLHLAQADFAPTQGCVALARADLERLIAIAGPEDALAIRLDRWGAQA
jgi:L,D-peptidoglycan transpeptidase YkuD (ErfK/YbiS/YcfS/YnhG family)